MVTCISCGSDVTGKKFCQRCGTAVQQPEALQVNNQFCPQCQGEVKPGAAFCMHCGASLRAQGPVAAVAPPPAMHVCSSCNTQVPAGVTFCTNCGHDLRISSQAAAAVLQCANCGRQNSPTMRFCGGCGSPLGATPAAQPNYAAQGQGQYPQYPQAQQAQYPQVQQAPYAQNPYPQQQYVQPYAQGGYQPQPMMGQQPMVLRCPTCMAMAPLGSAACVSCRTSLAGVVPMPVNAGMQGQQGGLGGFMQGQQGGLGGFMQGNGGKYAMGALGGAAAVIGGEMLLHGVENGIENRVEGDMGYGDYNRHHRRREEGLLGGLGELADDIGL